MREKNDLVITRIWNRYFYRIRDILYISTRSRPQSQTVCTKRRNVYGRIIFLPPTLQEARLQQNVLTENITKLYKFRSIRYQQWNILNPNLFLYTYCSIIIIINIKINNIEVKRHMYKMSFSSWNQSGLGSTQRKIWASCCVEYIIKRRI